MSLKKLFRDEARAGRRFRAVAPGHIEVIEHGGLTPSEMARIAAANRSTVTHAARNPSGTTLGS